MGLQPGDVTKALRLLLDAVVREADDKHVDIPERRYITTGGAVFDCAQVTVSGNSITTGFAGFPDAGGPIDNCPPGWHIDAELAIVRNAREAPVGSTSPPSVECIEADTQQAEDDAIVLTAAVEAIAGGRYDQTGTTPVSITFGEVQGGLTVVLCNASLNLWGVDLS